MQKQPFTGFSPINTPTKQYYLRMLLEDVLSLYLLVTNFFYTPSADQARQYASNVHKPLKGRLRPLRLAYYAYLTMGALRLTLYSVLREQYTRYDLATEVLDSVTTHHLIGLCLVPFIGLCIAYDYLLCVKAHQKVAIILVDLLVINQGLKAKENVWKKI